MTKATKGAAWREDQAGRARDTLEREAAVKVAAAAADALGHSLLWCGWLSAECFRCGARGTLVPAQPGMPPGHRGPYALSGAAACKSTRCTDR